MGWARTLLLGDIGNRLDIADAEEDINRIQRTQQRAENALQSKEREIAMLKDELGRQKLAIQALTRFLIEKGIIASTELDNFIALIDAEDGAVDGKMELDPASRRLRFPEKKVPDGTFRKTDNV
ncbi:MAG: hypothetical protein ABIS50_25575 [Luteolibacter sp.]|uniref:hypothetical protein n=1 Tax=Luteolibacter sp. TaxID=1962973 RepID=UPI0032659B25